MSRTRLTPAMILILVCSNCDKTRDVKEQTSPPAVSEESEIKNTDIESADKNPPSSLKEQSVLVFTSGKSRVTTRSAAIAEGLSIIDLSNYWVPFMFSERDNPDSKRMPNDFRPVFQKLANGWPYESRTMAEVHRITKRRAVRRGKNVGQGTKEAPNPHDNGPGDAKQYLEVYGILPTLSVLRRRALEEVERPCFDEVEFEKIKRYKGFLAYHGKDTAIARAEKGRALSSKLKEEMEFLGVVDPLELAIHRKSTLSKELIIHAIEYEALVEAQKQLQCEKLYRKGDSSKYAVGTLDWKTHHALLEFEKKNRVFGWGYFGGTTLEALKKKPKERLHDTFVRVLMERIVDSLGIIEDGSVWDSSEPPTYKDLGGEDRPLRNLIEEFTKTALNHMGLTNPGAVTEFLKRYSDARFNQLLIAIRLPRLPPYYSNNMPLNVEIDRGDVWYDYPFAKSGKRLEQARNRMPTLTLFVNWNEQRIPLAKMRTTIGGWRSELALDGYEYLRYKNSDVGPRFWKDIVTGPVWIPPDSTPPKELVKEVRYRGQSITVPNYDEFGPWYASAYGLVAAFHVRRDKRDDGAISWIDNGIRSHGSVDYTSILRRFSHGCHRLYNHLAIRLFDFVLRHRPYKRIGNIPVDGKKTFTFEDIEYTISIGNKGYLYELVEPVPVEVLPGFILGRHKSPIEHYMPRPKAEYGPDAEFLYRNPPREDGV
ncbi:MAG: hypothetical protein GY854_27235 [Deltaproteobacteria bacterium]|nr:hypothetical protein [Deltaproteobacteria bacterium]